MKSVAAAVHNALQPDLKGSDDIPDSAGRMLKISLLSFRLAMASASLMDVVYE